MRDIAEWSRELRLEISASPYFQQHLEELGESRGGKPLRHPDVFLIADVELGLALQMQVAPGQPAATVRPLLSGQRHVYAWIQDETNRHMVRVARFYLTSRKGSQWPRALQAYSKLPSELRLYDVDPVTGMVSLGTPRVAADRRDLYLRTLTQTPPHEPVKQRDRATPGKWVVRVSRLGESPQPVILEIPNEVEGISSCQPEFQRTRGALNPQMTIRWEDLAKAAQEMDTRLYESGYADEDYEGRFRRLNWHVFDEDSDDYRESRTFKLNGLHHIVGLLNAG
ncbi:MAG TPA: hypothetical protein VD973_23825, partial [Symbiobacteriaceae bacterium]|nr:hypothetical protein [Symbiobacteriaceae bacterium]